MLALRNVRNSEQLCMSYIDHSASTSVSSRRASMSLRRVSYIGVDEEKRRAEGGSFAHSPCVCLRCRVEASSDGALLLLSRALQDIGLPGSEKELGDTIEVQELKALGDLYMQVGR